MKTCNKCGVEKTLTEFFKRTCAADGLSRECRVCSNFAQRQRRIRNVGREVSTKYATIAHKPCSACKLILPLTDFHVDHVTATRRKSQCKSCSNASVKICKSNHPERYDGYMRRYWAIRGAEQQVAKNRNYFAKHYGTHAHVYKAAAAQRRANELSATPSWVDLGAVKEIYELCTQLQIVTGIPHEVDHIVPLRGARVSGLHVPWNLQILSRDENRRKGNKFAVE